MADVSVGLLDHYNLRTRKYRETVDFYTKVLGLENDPRPNFSFPGAWLYVGDSAVLHIIAGRKLPAEPGGVLDHMAFSASGLPAVTESCGNCTMKSRTAGSGSSPISTA